ncbi:MAG: flavin reductase, partial [Bacteroidota bacterium]
ATIDKILKSKKFSLSVLSKEASSSLIGEFGFMSSEDTNKFQKVETKTAATGAPIVLDSSVAWFDCEVISSHDVGTHLLIIGEVKDSDVVSDDDPLTYKYYREKFKMLSPKNAPTYIEKEKLDKEAEDEPEEKASENIENKEEKEDKSEKSDSTFTCSICGFQYNPEEGDPTAGIPPGTPFEDLPDDYKCPICNASKEYFRED